MIVGIILASVVCTLCNALFLFPIYIKVFHMSEEVIIKMCNTIIPYIDSMMKVYIFSVLPFNIVKFLISSVITYIFYKNISKHIKSILS